MEEDLCLEIDKKQRRRTAKFETPGWILGGVSLFFIIAGILSRIKPIIAIGILILGFAVFLIISGKLANETLLKK